MIVDCSHGNSGKDPERQAGVLDTVLRQIDAGDTAIAGFCLESHLLGGRQVWTPGVRPQPAVSITDSCIGWEATEQLLRNASAAVRQKRR